MNIAKTLSLTKLNFLRSSMTLETFICLKLLKGM